MVKLLRHLPHSHPHANLAASSQQLPAVADLPAQSLLTHSHNSSAWTPAHYRDVLLHSSKYNHWHGEFQEKEPFLNSIQFVEWVVLLALLEVFFCMHLFILLKHPPKGNHSCGSGLMFALWITIAAGYNCLMCWQDLQKGLMWNAGYFLELMSLMENIFVFHVIIQSFRVPRNLVRKALFMVACLQIIFQAVLFLGFADILRNSRTFQYILGAWLVFCGYLAVDTTSNSHDVRFKDWYVYRIIQAPLGYVLSERYEGDSLFFLDPAARHYRCSLLLPVILLLGLAGLSLEVDSTFLKIEELENTFVSFSSSAIATVMMPDVFLLAEHLFCRFKSVKYGIAFALTFFGAQLLLHEEFTIPTILSCAIVLVVLLLCTVPSLLWPEKPELDEPELNAET